MAYSYFELPRPPEIVNRDPEKIVLSLHKFPVIVFNDDDIEERTSRWVIKCIKKFNPYARYGVENWKNPHAKIFYIRRQKEPGRPKEEIYSNSKIVQVIKTYWELGHEHKFITEIVARRANDCIVSITKPDYKNLNKNDIEDMYLLIVNNKITPLSLINQDLLYLKKGNSGPEKIILNSYGLSQWLSSEFMIWYTKGARFFNFGIRKQSTEY
ncbi:hypothetical protein Tco_0947728 [Tanacetum coccineum]